MKHFISAFIILLTCTSALHTQINIPHYSEPAFLMQQVGNTKFEISYERPKKNDRKIYGGLVPYNQVWRTGASMCTTISFDTEVYIDNEKIKAGKYALFTIPNEAKWTIILNTDTTLYGAHGYEESKDILRFSVAPEKTDYWSEAFNINFDIMDDNAKVNIHWENTLVSFRIETKTYDKLRIEVIDILNNDYELKNGIYSHAADFILHNGIAIGPDFLELAEQLVDKGFKVEGNSNSNFNKKRQILQIQGRKIEYIKWSKDHIKYLEDAKPYDGYEEGIEEIKMELAKL